MELTNFNLVPESPRHARWAEQRQRRLINMTQDNRNVVIFSVLNLKRENILESELASLPEVGKYRTLLG